LKKRGPIEAYAQRQVSLQCRQFPRLKKRGPIEARGLCEELSGTIPISALEKARPH